MVQFYVNNVSGDEPQDKALPKENTQRRFDFAVGALVRTRGRDWKVLPGSTETLLRIAPVFGSPVEETAVLAGVDFVESAVFPPPNPEGEMGNFLLGRNLRDAFRFRVSECTGPFRSFGRINCTPRSYQLVPLIMALRQKTVRLLIADDVGIGKTIEAGLIVRELCDRDEIKHFSVVCPPHLAPQWKKELFEKFHLEAEIILPHTAARLEEEILSNKSIFQEYNTIISIDYIKNEERRQKFLKNAPELVVIDEAHLLGVTAANEKQQRHQFAQELCRDKNRNILLLTATPHSGKSDAFRSLLALLREDFARLPKNLSSKKREKYRKQIRPYFVERVRGDILDVLDERTCFPTRKDGAICWKLTPEYRKLFVDIISFAKELVGSATGEKRHQRMRLWSALALILTLASSPEAAKSTLLSRVVTTTGHSPEEEEKEADLIGQKSVLGCDFEEEDTSSDLSVGCRFDDDPEKNKLLDELAKAAEELKKNDPKLAVLKKEITKLLKDGFSPIVFCHYIETAKYLGEELSGLLSKDTAVATVTSRIASEDRERRIDELCQSEKRVLICTDCLSEGINLQESFNAVIHYDLCWNPTRYAQREGRVDRFGQENPEIRCRTIYGEDNWIDKYILRNNEEKLKKIKQDTGVEISVSGGDGGDIGLFFDQISRELSLFSDDPQRVDQEDQDEEEDIDIEGTFDFGDLDEDFDDPEDTGENPDTEESIVKQTRGRTIFAQRPLNKVIESLRPEIAATVGSMEELRQFVLGVLKQNNCYRGEIEAPDDHSSKSYESSAAYEVNFDDCGEEMRSYIPERLLEEKTVYLRFDPIHAIGEESICRTHPLVEGLAEYTKNSAMEGAANSPARRCGVVCTNLVREVTTVILLRCRYRIIQTKPGKSSEKQVSEKLAEEVRFIGFTGGAGNPCWLSEEELQKVLAISSPSGNISPGAAANKLKQILDDDNDNEGEKKKKASLKEQINQQMNDWAKKIQESQQRVRNAEAPQGGMAITCEVQPVFPADWLGVYRFVPPTKHN